MIDTTQIKKKRKFENLKDKKNEIIQKVDYIGVRRLHLLQGYLTLEAHLPSHSQIIYNPLWVQGSGQRRPD